MANIVYEPHCSECGHLINTNEYDVTYQESFKLIRGVLAKYGTDISPVVCPYCHAAFDTIEIIPPTKLPDIYNPC